MPQACPAVFDNLSTLKIGPLDMPKLTINGTETEVAAGATVLDACRQIGVDVPTLCFLVGHEPHTSCMICMVKDVKGDRLIPACSAPATAGMQIETDSADVLESRQTTIEMLLSEHLGDCEGPCEVACPAQIHIPGVIRKLLAGDHEGAAAIYRDTQTLPGIPCTDCPGRCEKPCRRKQIDSAVAIRAMMLYAASALAEDYEPPPPRDKRFNCVVGRLHDDDKAGVMQAAADYGRTEPAAGEVFNAAEAAGEAARCLHCDCRKPATCRLRLYADRYGARRSRYKAVTRKAVRVIQDHPNVVYEPGKCIKCGICLKLTEAAGEPLGLAFVGRGYDGEVAVPFEESLARALTMVAEECVRHCPTGALSHPAGEPPHSDG